MYIDMPGLLTIVTVTVFLSVTIMVLMSLRKKPSFEVWRNYYLDHQQQLSYISDAKAMWYEALILDILERGYEYARLRPDWARNFMNGAFIWNPFTRSHEGELVDMINVHGLLVQRNTVENVEDIQYGFNDSDFSRVLAASIHGTHFPRLMLRFLPNTTMYTLEQIGLHNKSMFQNDPNANWSYTHRRGIGDVVIFKLAFGVSHARLKCVIEKIDVAEYTIRVIEVVAKGPQAQVSVGQVFENVRHSQIWADMWQPSIVGAPHAAEGLTHVLAN